MPTTARPIRLALLAALLTISCFAAEAVKTEQPAEGAIAYRVLATNKTSTMEKEMNEAAELGFELSDMMGGETLGGNEIVSVMIKRAGASSERRFEYKLLATSKTSTMLKELNEAGALGFRYRGQSVAETAFGGQEVVSVLSRSIEEPARRYVYQLRATKRTKTMDKELNEAGQEGFELMGVTVSKTTFGGKEIVSILMRGE